MKTSAVTFALILASSAAAMAQGDPMAAARTAAANQIGVMEYCQGKGWADQADVDAQRASMADLTTPAGNTREASAAEATGKSGSLLNNGQAMPLAGMASQTHTTEQQLCGKMAESAKMMQSQTSGMSGGMPAMPGGMPAMPSGMPTMPSGMTMPTMPGMPKTQ